MIDEDENEVGDEVGDATCSRTLFLHAREVSEEINGITRWGTRSRNVIGTRSVMSRGRSVRSWGRSARVGGLTRTGYTRALAYARALFDHLVEHLKVIGSKQGNLEMVTWDVFFVWERFPH